MKKKVLTKARFKFSAVFQFIPTLTNETGFQCTQLKTRMEL